MSSKLALKLRLAAKNKFGKDLDAKMNAAAAALEAEAKQLCSVQGSASNRSKPGEPPRRQTGRGMNSIRARWDKLSRSLYLTAVNYMLILEKRNRPWQRTAIEKARAMFKDLLVR